MESRTKTTLFLSVVLMVMVMGVAAFVSTTGLAGRDKWSMSENWSQPATAPSVLKVANMTGAGKADLFIQAGSQVLVYDAAGQKVFDKTFPGTLAAVMGDVDGDGVQDVIAYSMPESDALVEAYHAKDGERLWQVRVPEMGPVGRAAVVDFDKSGKSGAVISDLHGHLAAISPDGRLLWRYQLNDGSELKGLDNILSAGGQLVVAATTGGDVEAVDGSGQTVWTYNVPGGLRRLRTEELVGAGQSAVLIGGETGLLAVLDGPSGKALWTADLGQAITEIRLAELDGNPSTHEFVAGGKRNGVWAYDQNGRQLFSAGVGGSKVKVTEIASMDAGSGRDVVAVGDETGTVTFFDAQGAKLLDKSFQGAISRMAVGKVAGRTQFLVGDDAQVHAVTLADESAPFWYSPLVAGLLACAVIAGVAVAVGTMKPAPALQISAEQMTVEAQKARRIMLLESINDLKKMQGSGEVPADAYLARLKDLRAQLADVDANLIKLGVPLKAETFKCPNCGGTLELGTDRCDYCGQTVIIQ